MSLEPCVGGLTFVRGLFVEARYHSLDWLKRNLGLRFYGEPLFGGWLKRIDAGLFK